MKEKINIHAIVFTLYVLGIVFLISSTEIKDIEEYSFYAHSGLLNFWTRTVEGIEFEEFWGEKKGDKISKLYLKEFLEESAEIFKIHKKKASGSKPLKTIISISLCYNFPHIALRLLPFIEDGDFKNLLSRMALEPTVDYNRNDIKTIYSENISSWLQKRLHLRYFINAGIKGGKENFFKQELIKNIRKESSSFIGRLILIVSFILISGLFGVILLINTLKKVKKNDELPPLPSPFSGTPLQLYTIIMGYFSFYLSTSLLLPVVFKEAEFKNEIMSFTIIYIINGLFALYLIKHYALVDRMAPFFTLVGIKFEGISPINLILTSILFFFMAIYPVNAASLLNSIFIPSPQEHPFIPILSKSNREETAIIIFNVAILAPFFEEIFFRGYIFRKLQDFMKTNNAALLSGFAFACFHTNFSTLLPITILGYLLALSYNKTKSLITPMIFHSIWNLCNIIILIFIVKN